MAVHKLNGITCALIILICLVWCVFVYLAYKKGDCQAVCDLPRCSEYTRFRSFIWLLCGEGTELSFCWGEGLTHFFLFNVVSIYIYRYSVLTLNIYTYMFIAIVHYMPFCYVHVLIYSYMHGKENTHRYPHMTYAIACIHSYSHTDMHIRIYWGRVTEGKTCKPNQVCAVLYPYIVVLVEVRKRVVLASSLSQSAAYFIIIDTDQPLHNCKSKRKSMVSRNKRCGEFWAFFGYMYTQP